MLTGHDLLVELRLEALHLLYARGEERLQARHVGRRHHREHFLVVLLKDLLERVQDVALAVLQDLLGRRLLAFGLNHLDGVLLLGRLLLGGLGLRRAVRVDLLLVLLQQFLGLLGLEDVGVDGLHHSPVEGALEGAPGVAEAALEFSKASDALAEKDGKGIVVGRLEDAAQLHHVVAQQRTLLIDVCRFRLLVAAALLLDVLEIHVERFDHIGVVIYTLAVLGVKSDLLRGKE